MTFDPTGATVVDSPLPSTPLDPNPISGAVPGITGTAPDAPAVDSSTGQDAAPSPHAQELADLSETFGRDFSQFTTIEDARAAAALFAQDYAAPVQSGWEPAAQQYAPYQQPAPQQPQVDYLDKVLADGAIDPAIKADLQAAKQLYQQQLVQHQQLILQQQAQHNQFVRSQVDSLIDGELDKIASSQFGVGGNRSVFQESARQAFRQQIWNTAQNLAAQGRAVPRADKLARILASQQGQQVAPKAQGAALQPKSQGAGKAGSIGPAPINRKPYDPLGLQQDPDFRAGLAAIKAKY